MSSAMAHSSVVAVVSVAAPNMSWNYEKFIIIVSVHGGAWIVGKWVIV
jgi:hypothetical protein